MKQNNERYRRVHERKQRRYIIIGLFVLLAGSGVGYSAENPHGDLKMDCETCHTTASWSNVEFPHEGVGFVLNDSHTSVSCDRCHDIKNFSGAARDCLGCHQDVHESRLGPDCERCHTPRRWEIFDTEEIHARTRFPLLGRHVQIDCRNCHADLLEGDYAVSARDCVDCHEGDYLKTGNPEHVSLGIGTSCSECHEPIQWRPAYFPSHDAVFPVFSGNHSGVWDMCSDCHPDPSTFTVFSCFKCHSRSAMDGVHAGIQGYSYDNQACLGCHPRGSKEGGIAAAHDANYFPIFTGTHASAWEACSQCHTLPGNFGSFSCLECHEHDQPTMDNRHAGIPGYSYDSVQCLSCHPTGERGEFLAHDQDYFPIYSGRHAGTWGACSECHIVPNDPAVVSCLECHEHDQPTMDNRHAGIPGYSYDTHQCLGCHPTGEGGEFQEHDQLYFPIYSGRHRETWDDCTTCHTDPNAWSVFSCIDCHEHRQSEMDEKHREVNGYSYNSQACYDCHPTGQEIMNWKRPRISR